MTTSYLSLIGDILHAFVPVLYAYITFIQAVITLLAQFTANTGSEYAPSNNSDAQTEAPTTRDTTSPTPAPSYHTIDEEAISRQLREEYVEFIRQQQIASNEHVLGHGYRYCSRSYPCLSHCNVNRPCHATTTDPSCTSLTLCGHQCSTRQPCGWQNPRSARQQL